MAAENATMTVDLNVEGSRLRAEALDLATRSYLPGDRPSVAVERAQAYYKFLKGDES